MASTASSQEFRAGDVLATDGEKGDHLLVIQSGSVRLHKDIDGEETTIADLGEGDFVGEVAAFLGGKHTATATATAPTKCLVIKPGALEAMVAGEAEIAAQLIVGLTRRIAICQDLLSLVGQRDSRTRVGLALVRHARNEGVSQDGGVWIGRKLSSICDEVAVPRSEVGEISKVLVKEKLLRVKRDGVLLPDVAKLEAFIRSGDG